MWSTEFQLYQHSNLLNGGFFWWTVQVFKRTELILKDIVRKWSPAFLLQRNISRVMSITPSFENIFSIETFKSSELLLVILKVLLGTASRCVRWAYERSSFFVIDINFTSTGIHRLYRVITSKNILIRRGGEASNPKTTFVLYATCAEQH